MVMLRHWATTWVLSVLAATFGSALEPPRAQRTGILRLAKRATCPSTLPVSCGSGDGLWCCASGWLCTSDADGNDACCPSGAVCTGTVAEPTGVSYVANTYYPFPYIGTSFSNAGVCSAAYQLCSSNYELCTLGLEGTAAYGVTIAVPGGGGTTVTAAGYTLASTSAESICSSLSTEACHGISAAVCEQTGTVGVFVVSSSWAHGRAISSTTRLAAAAAAAAAAYAAVA